MRGIVPGDKRRQVASGVVVYKIREEIIRAEVILREEVIREG